MWEGVDSSQQDLPPTPLKGGVFSVNNLGTRSFCLRGKTHPKGPNKHLPVFSHKMAAISPNFPEEKGGGAHNFTNSLARVILEFS